MLNRISNVSNTLCTKSNGSVLIQPEGESKWVWLPTTNDTIDMSRLLIQIETAAQEMFQSETSQSLPRSLDCEAVFEKIANDLIKVKAKAENDSPTTIKKNNANTAKADIKG